MDIQKYIKSLSNPAPIGASHGLLNVMVSACIGGYMLSGFPTEFLTIFENPIFQYPVMLVLFETNTLHRRVDYWWIYADALIATIVLLIIKLIIEVSYGKKPRIKFTMDWQQALILTVFFALTVNMINNEYKHKSTKQISQIR